MKTDVPTGAALAGAVYELRKPAGTELQTQTTGADGVAPFENLQPGIYPCGKTARPRDIRYGLTGCAAGHRHGRRDGFGGFC